MIGEYARLTAEELDRALSDPDWAYDHVQDMIEDEAAELGDVPRCTDIDKAWDGIRFLFDRAGVADVDVVAGGTLMKGEDWGYGPARYLVPDEVDRAARRLRTTPFEHLAAHYDATRMREQEVYPHAIWDDDRDTLDYLKDHYEILVEFFDAAAESGDAMIIWLD
jgi:hypothetical protein